MYFLTSLIRRRLFHLIFLLDSLSIFFFATSCMLNLSLELRWISPLFLPVRDSLKINLIFHGEIWHFRHTHIPQLQPNEKRARDRGRDRAGEEERERKRIVQTFFSIFGKQFYAKDLYRFIVVAFYLFFTGSEVSSIEYKSLCCIQKMWVDTTK